MSNLARVFVSALKVGDVLWCSRHDIANGSPHPHVIVAYSEGIFYTVCGTSQMETIERKANLRFNGDFSLFPAVSPSHGNGLTKVTYFDCSVYFEIQEFHLVQEKGRNPNSYNRAGEITYGQYDQLRTALCASATIDICDLLVHQLD